MWFFDLGTDLLNTGINLLFVSGTVNDGGVIFVDNNTLCGSKIVDSNVFKLDSEIFSDYLATSKDCDIFKHCLSAITKTRSFYSSNI